MKLFLNISIIINNHQTLLETDGSGYGVSAVLMQHKDSSSQWYPVHIASRTLNAAEQNYSNIEHEALIKHHLWNGGIPSIFVRC